MEFIFSFGGFLFLFEAWTSLTRLLRTLARQIDAIRWEAGLNPGFFAMPIPVWGGKLGENCASESLI